MLWSVLRFARAGRWPSGRRLADLVAVWRTDTIDHRDPSAILAQNRGCFMPDAFILAAARTPVGKFLGELSELAAPQLGAIALKEALARAKAPADRINEAIFGNVLQAGVGQNPARQVPLKAGLPDTSPA